MTDSAGPTGWLDTMTACKMPQARPTRRVLPVVQLGGPVPLALLLALAGAIVFVYGVQWNAQRVIGTLIVSDRPLFPGSDGAAGSGRARL